MLIALGFLAASLLGLLIAPIFWSRAVRLTSWRIKQTMPLSETEIEADRDRIRAEYAIKMHKLESLVEQVKLAAARQQIEINRRDARVNMLEGDLEKLQASYEEAQNARRVLEQTIADRIPKIEGRLTEAKKVLFAREREVEEMSRTSERQVQALADASALNQKLQSEIESARAQNAGRGSRGGSDVGLRAEIDTLKTKIKEQAQIIDRLQGTGGRGASESGATVARGAAARVKASALLTELRTQNDDQAGEIARLKAAIAVFERDAEADGKGAPQSQAVALKAKLEALETQASQQAAMVAKLRAELAAAHERLAQQASHFTSELKRLGGGAGQNRRGRVSLADRVAQARATFAGESSDGEDGEAKSRTNPADADAAGDAEDLLAAENERELNAQLSAADRNKEAVLSELGDGAEPPREQAVAAAGNRPRLLDRLAGLSRTS